MKKTLITILVTVLVCGSVFGTTLAFLMDKTDTITNTFTYGNINITLTESDDLDLKMIPGQAVEKDPKVTVIGGSEACWLFVKINKSANYSEFFDAYDVAENWTALEGVDGVYYRKVAYSTSDQEFPVLLNDQVMVKNSVFKAQFDAIKDKTAPAPTLALTAYAVQSEGVADAATAWGYTTNP